jgi:hypothetical protein
MEEAREDRFRESVSLYRQEKREKEVQSSTTGEAGVRNSRRKFREPKPGRIAVPNGIVYIIPP